MDRVIVVGGTSGLGAELAHQLESSGNPVVRIGSRPSQLPNSLQHDVRNVQEVEACFEQAKQLLGGIDVLIYAAGVMHPVGETEFPTLQDQQMIEVNVTGAVAWCNAAAVHFRSQGSGKIIGIGSLAGIRGRPGKPVYNATKAFLHSYLESLRCRGLHVLTVIAGPIDTPMTAHHMVKKLPVHVAARRILAHQNRNGNLYLVPWHRLAFGIIRLLPWPLLRKLP